MRNAHVVEEPLGLFEIFGEITKGYAVKTETGGGVS